MSVRTPPFIMVYFRDKTRDKAYQASGWVTLSVHEEEFGDGEVVLTLRHDQVPITATDLIDPNKAHDYWLDVYVNDDTEPLIKSRVDEVTAAWDAQGDVLYTLAATPLLEHLFSRKINSTSNQSKVSLTTYPDYVLWYCMNNAHAALTPNGYPGGISRFNYGPYDVAVATAPVQSNFGATVTYEEQSSNSLWSSVVGVCARYDLYITVTESQIAGPKAKFTLGIDYPYQDADQSAKFEFSDRNGTLVRWRRTIGYRDLINTFLGRGDGDEAAQVKLFRTDTTSVSNWGVYEGVFTIPSATGVAGAQALYEELTQQLTRAVPTDTFELAVRDTDAFRFNVDWKKRHKIAFACYAIGDTATGVVKAYSFTSNNGLPPEIIDITVGDTNRDLVDEILLRLGIGKNGNATGRFQNNNG